MAAKVAAENAGTSKTQGAGIRAPNILRAVFHLEGTAPYVQARFSAKAMQAMMAKHAAGSQAKKGKAKEARNFEDDYEQAKHVAAPGVNGQDPGGWCGIPAGGFRQAMISACRLVGFKMTLAKLSLFVEADGFDKVDGTPLVRLFGDPERLDMAVRNATGVTDIRVRPMWRAWSADVRVSYDADQFSLDDVKNLFTRVGLQVGIGEGRPDSKDSAGLGWGLFSVELKG